MAARLYFYGYERGVLIMAEAVSPEVCKIQHKNIDKNFQKIEDDYRGLNNDIVDLSKLYERQTVILENLSKLTEKHDTAIEEIKAKPGRRWDAVVNTLISVGVGTAIGLFIAK